jgi:hypothetical protein
MSIFGHAETQNRRLAQTSRRRLSMNGKKELRPSVLQAHDLFFHLQFFSLEFADFEIVRPRMGQRFVDLILKSPMLLFEFRKVRLHRHAKCLLNQVFPDTVSLPESAPLSTRNPRADFDKTALTLATP